MKKTILTTVGLALMALTPMAASQNLADFGIPASSDNPDAVRQVEAPRIDSSSDAFVVLQ